MKSYPQWYKVAAVAVATSLALSACGKGESGGAAGANHGGGAAGGQAPAPVVGVVTVQVQPVALSVELPGRLEPVRSAEVRPQVGGIIKRRLFQEGTYVRAGQPLYQIDDATYAAGLESAYAQLAGAEAALAKANADLSRYKPLVEADAISRQEYDAAVAAKLSAQASVKAAAAAVKSSRINLNYSRVTAPISGFIGQSFVSEGTLVNPGAAVKLATIQQTDPMYINITQSATEIMQLRQDIADGKLQPVNGGIEVAIMLENGKEYAHKGRLLYADPTVDEATGQVKLRVAIPNPDNILLPGLYVRAKMSQAGMAEAFVVPQQAVTRGQQDTVLIVNAEGGMEPRVVTVVQQQGSNWIISDGLKDGDKVIVDGVSIAGMMGAKKVTPKEWTPPVQAEAAGQSEAAAADKPEDVQTASQAASEPAQAQ
ncbi:efflux RND transporter periplasmic adaptor subunit [Neisseria weaveri]|uniref:efflux RND transporter periplasmic adaptor subunit n=1 Tax=Neisseria weaveri TaxID=28091 RepID=UPI000D2F5AC5|nr:efflux RND transporter periplasmic adaptor subunit [Neisseria weaveri]